MKPQFFATPTAFWQWLEAHHDTTTEIVVGFHRIDSGVASMTWTESVRVALCFGWIDGHVKRLDATRYTRRFTPRKATSTWSAVNVRHMKELIESGAMQSSGRAAFERRTGARSSVYSFEQPDIELPEPLRSELQAHTNAHDFWTAQPASYRKAVTWWILTAKQDTTKRRRFATLLAHAVNGERIPQFTSGKLPTSRARDAFTFLGEVNTT